MASLASFLLAMTSSVRGVRLRLLPAANTAAKFKKARPRLDRRSGSGGDPLSVEQVAKGPTDGGGAEWAGGGGGGGEVDAMGANQQTRNRKRSRKWESLQPPAAPRTSSN